MQESLSRHDIPNVLHLWEGEAHRARYWRQMVAEYL
jgi:esterase/lipase superfamily enzyme